MGRNVSSTKKLRYPAKLEDWILLFSRNLTDFGKSGDLRGVLPHWVLDLSRTEAHHHNHTVRGNRLCLPKKTINILSQRELKVFFTINFPILCKERADRLLLLPPIGNFRLSRQEDFYFYAGTRPGQILKLISSSENNLCFI